MPWDPGVQITPLPEPGKVPAMQSLVDDAVAKGARVVNAQGQTAEATFMRPAVVYPVSPEARLYQEEQFGPVVPVAAFHEIDAPLRYVIESDDGQQISIFGSDPAEIAVLVDPLVNQVCRVNINSQCQRGPDTFPFTGRKDSAEGTLSVSDALRVLTIRTLVAAKESDANRAIIRSIVSNRSSTFLSTDFIL
jgi:glyceraldehyde-3-phosphate dehydrogenase (NADP+)